MARERQVFPTSEIPHKWAHQTQESARNPQGNLYFRGPTIYSYRDGWPLARIYARKDGRRLVLTNCDRYSTTTAQHQSAVNRACQHLPRIDVPHVHDADRGRHGDNLAHVQNEMARLHSEAGRAMTERNVQWRAERCAELHKDMADYMMFFGIRRKMPALLSFAAHYERARRIENPDPVRDARKVKAREQAAARKIAAAFVQVNCARTAWRMGESLPYFIRGRRVGPGHQALRVDVPIMLRINGDEIETSAGARIPLAVAPMVWERVQRALGKGYKPAGLGVKIGDYPLTEIRPDGTLVAGCHEIPHSELRSMARALGLAAV